jgi:hypothetical protein
MARKSKAPAPQSVVTDERRVAEAIKEGQALIAQGKTKIDAAMAIYRLIEDHSQETLVRAFVEGAALTERGALTYWYNCRRKRARELHEGGR